MAGAVPLLGESRQRTVTGTPAGPLGCPLDLLAQRGLTSGRPQPVEVEPLIGAGQQRLLCQVRHVLAVGGDAARNASSQACSGKPLCRPVTHTLVTSRRKSHSQAAGGASSKSLRPKMRSRSGEA